MAFSGIDDLGSFLSSAATLTLTPRPAKFRAIHNPESLGSTGGDYEFLLGVGGLVNGPVVRSSSAEEVPCSAGRYCLALSIPEKKNLDRIRAERGCCAEGVDEQRLDTMWLAKIVNQCWYGEYQLERSSLKSMIDALGTKSFALHPARGFDWSRLKRGIIQPQG